MGENRHVLGTPEGDSKFNLDVLAGLAGGLLVALSLIGADATLSVISASNDYLSRIVFTVFFSFILYFAFAIINPIQRLFGVKYNSRKF